MQKLALDINGMTCEHCAKSDRKMMGGGEGGGPMQMCKDMTSSIKKTPHWPHLQPLTCVTAEEKLTLQVKKHLSLQQEDYEKSR